MADVPEMPKEELKPIPPKQKHGVDLGSPVPVPDMVVHKATVVEKAVLPARESVIWEAIRHFMFGSLSMGTGAVGALVASGAMANPYAWYIVGGFALAGGVVEAVRKVKRINSGGKDWTDLLYKLIEIIIAYFASRKKKE